MKIHFTIPTRFRWNKRIIMSTPTPKDTITLTKELIEHYDTVTIEFKRGKDQKLTFLQNLAFLSLAFLSGLGISVLLKYLGY